MLLKVRKILVTIALCFVLAGINQALSTGVKYFVPLYADTVMTAFAGFRLGLWPSLAVGFITNMILGRIKYIGDIGLGILPTTGFTLCNMAVGFLCWLFARFIPPRPLERSRFHRAFFVCTVLFALAITMALVESFLGGLIATWWLVDPAGPEFDIQSPLYQSGLSRAAVEIISRIPINMIDRPLTVFIAYGLSRIPRLSQRPK
jgi:hypothetical protein